jgi:glycosyltransferase involved in cell wall biosynthesis
MLDKKNDKLVVCELAHFANAFCGNFMASLFDLEKKINGRNNGSKIIYAFYKNSLDCNWAKEMVQNNKDIFFINDQNIKGFIELRKIIKNNKVNILHLHFNFPVIILFLLKIYSPKTKILAHFHNTITGVPGMGIKQILKIKIKKILYNRVIDIFCGCSEAVYYDLINCGMNKNRCRYIDNGIVFSRLDIDCNDGKEIFNIKNKKVILIYGTEFYRKGVDVAINAIKDIVHKYNIVLLITCQNKYIVIEQIKNILGHIPDWIIIVPPEENISLYYRMSDIYLTPSREEGFSYALLESIYCGTLTIRSDIPAMDRKIPNELVVPVNDIHALRQSMEYALNLADNTKQDITTEQKKFVIARWNINIWSGKIIDLYSQLLNNT